MTQATFALQGRNPDVLTCIANLSNDEVFTPPQFANEMLDALEARWADANTGANIWADAGVRFLDPFTKSGVFLREIVKRLVVGIEKAIPDLEQRVDHILSQQVFGIAVTNLTSLLARRSVYCSKWANGKHSVAKSLGNESGNIWFERTEHSWASGKCRYCGASEADYGRGSELETYAYAFIHTDDIRARVIELFGEDMHFDVIIGNPPYHLDDGGASASATPIYNRFVEQAKKLDPRLLSMVIPARWYAGGKGLNQFRSSMLEDGRIRVLHDYPDTTDVFPGVNNRGGVCYFLWDRDNPGDVAVSTHEKGVVTSTATRPMLEPGLDTFIRYNEGIDILRKVVLVETGEGQSSLALPAGKRFSELVSSRKPFGLDTTFSGHATRGKGDVLVYRNGGTCFTSRSKIQTSTASIDAVKLLVPYASPGSDDYPHLVLSRPIVAGPGEVATETYLVIGPFESEMIARNVATYMGTQFFRFMLTLLRVSQHVTRSVYSLAPVQDFSRTWSDEDLATRYGLTADEQTFMARFVKPVAWAGDYV